MSTFDKSNSLLLAHRVFIGATPIEAQARLYASFPAVRGFSALKTKEIFEACLIMALVQTYPQWQRPDPFKCYLFVPGSVEKHAGQLLHECTGRMFTNLKSKHDGKSAELLGVLFPAVLMGSRVLQIPQAPERWVAFGFEREGLIPPWMKTALLERV